MAFLTEKDLEEIGFKKIGRNVKISNKASIYNPELIEIGDHSRIDDFCVLSGKIIIGRNVHIAIFCNLAGGEKGIVMEDFSGLAYHCNVFTQSDDYTGRTLTNPTVPDVFKKETKKAVKIGKHVIVGAGSLIFPGVEIAEGCSIGSMSMLTKSTIPWTVYFGIPAKPLKKRKDALLEMEKKYLEQEKNTIN